MRRIIERYRLLEMLTPACEIARTHQLNPKHSVTDHFEPCISLLLCQL
jgi:hypothetical protein